jgi:outer membrane protein
MIYFHFHAIAQEDITLEEAINIALNKNTLLLKSENSLESYQSNVKAAYGNLFPTLSATGSWNWNRAEEGGSIFTIPGTGITIPVEPSVTETRSYSASVNSNVTLFDGLSNYANVSQSKNDFEAAKLSFERIKQDVVYQTIGLYNLVINAQQLLKVSEENVKWNQKNLETVTERNRLGAVTLADVYAQQVRSGNSELEFIRAQNNLETAKSNLLYYLGLDVLQNYTFSDSLTSTEIELLDKDLSDDYENITALVQQALNTRVDYRSAKLSLESAFNGVTMAMGGYFPRLTGGAGFSSFANRLDDLFDNKSYSVGLTLSIPIFSGFSVDNQVQFAEVNAKNTELDLLDLERDIKRNIQKTFLDLQAANKELDVSRRNVIAAQENQKIEQEKYSLGSGTLLNVLIANSEYTNAQTNYYNAQFAYIVLSEQLKYQLGTLDYKQYE